MVVEVSNSDTVSNASQAIVKTEAFLNYIHSFRGIAILAIVAHHVIACLQWENPEARKTTLILLGNGSIYFVFIAGFLFQFLSPKYQFKSFLSKKLKWVITPYLILSIPAIVLCLTETAGFKAPEWFSQQFSEWPTLGQTVMFFLTGAHLPPFWFIPMISIFYLVSPLLIKIDRNPRLYSFLPALIVLTLLVPRPEFNHNPFQSFVHFLSIYVVGMYCCHFRDRLFAFLQQHYLLVVLGLASLFFLEFRFEQNLVAINSLSKLILCLLTIYLLRVIDPHLPEQFHHPIGSLANYSFGIYFLHGYFLQAVGIIETILNVRPFFTQASLVNFLLSYGLALGMSLITILGIRRLLNKSSRLVIGC